MSLLAEIKTDVAHLGAKLEAFDEDALTVLEKVQASPEAATLFSALGSVAGLPTLPGNLLNGITAMLKTYAPAPAEVAPAPAEPLPADVPQAAPQGPVVAGQA